MLQVRKPFEDSRRSFLFQNEISRVCCRCSRRISAASRRGLERQARWRTATLVQPMRLVISMRLACLIYMYMYQGVHIPIYMHTDYIYGCMRDIQRDKDLRKVYT